MTVMPAGEEPGVADEVPGSAAEQPVAEGTAADWLPGLRDEHEDDRRAGRLAGSTGRPGTGP